MNRQNVIVIVSPVVESWGNFKKMCIAKGLPYHSLKDKPFPITHNEYVIHKCQFQ